MLKTRKRLVFKYDVNLRRKPGNKGQPKEVIDLIIDKRKEGYSIQRICLYLDSKEIRPRFASKWSKSTVRRIIKKIGYV